MQSVDLKVQNLKRFGGYAAISSALFMIIGAVFQSYSETNLWMALIDNDIQPILEQYKNVKTILTINFSFWILGVIFLGITGSILVELCTRERIFAKVALVCYQLAVPLAVLSFLMMLSLAIQIPTEFSESSLAAVKIIGWISVRADDIATLLFLGVGPFFISLSGRSDWIPKWLVRWGYLAGPVAVISILVFYSPELHSFSLLILPVGLGWMISVGIVLLKSSKI